MPFCVADNPIPYSARPVFHCVGFSLHESLKFAATNKQEAEACRGLTYSWKLPRQCGVSMARPFLSAVIVFCPCMCGFLVVFVYRWCVSLFGKDLKGSMSSAHVCHWKKRPSSGDIAGLDLSEGTLSGTQELAMATSFNLGARDSVLLNESSAPGMAKIRCSCQSFFWVDIVQNLGITSKGFAVFIWKVHFFALFFRIPKCNGM